MSDIPNISEEYNFFEKLFDNAEKDQIGDLYKKELYIMKEDLDQNKYKTTLKLMHDTLLQKFMSEDYTEFIPKNEVAQLINPPDKKDPSNSNKNLHKEDAVDKELLEEYEYLKELYRLNYLTFSPFAIEYFEKISDPNKFEQSNKSNENNVQKKESNKNVNNINNNKDEVSEEQKEKDAKLLKLLNFDYNSYELNNDLLFNIAQGFIDVSKLKESNLKYSDKKTMNKSIDSDSSKNESEELYEYDEELNHDLIEKTMNFVRNFEKNLLLKRAIVKFKDELSRLPPKCKNKIKNDFYKSWDIEFAKLAKDNDKLIKRKEEEDKRKKLLKQKLHMDKLKREKELEEENKLNKEKELIDQLRKIQNNAKIKNGIKNKKNNIKSQSKSKSKSKDKSHKKKKKNVNRSAPNVKKELIKSNKKYYCSGFNIFKEMLSNKHREASA